MPDAYRVIISPEASTDLQTIHAFIANDSPNNAATMIERILDAIELLKEVPHRTAVERQSRKIKHPVRSLPVKPYVIFFRAIDDEKVVRILTVRHGARRRPRRFD
jgi:plasmid stabilization system protein ParE